MDSKKKPPAWGSAVGILGIIFGALGLVGGAHELMMPAMLDALKVTKSMKPAVARKLPKTENSCPEADGKSCEKGNPTVRFEPRKGQLARPDWAKSWFLVNGSLGLLLGGAYILASVFLLRVKRGAPTIFLGVLVACMLRNIISGGVVLSAGWVGAIWNFFTALSGFVIDLALLIVIVVSDKSPYSEMNNDAK